MHKCTLKYGRTLLIVEYRSLQRVNFFSVYNLPFYKSQLMMTEHREVWRFDESDQLSLNRCNCKKKGIISIDQIVVISPERLTLYLILLHVYYNISYLYGDRSIELLIFQFLNPHFRHPIYVINKTVFPLQEFYF